MGAFNRSGKRRLFLVLYPEQRQRQQLADTVEQQLSLPLSVKPVPVCNLHITLVFIGSVDMDTQIGIESLCADVTAPAFGLALDRFGYWPRKKMLWAMPDPKAIPDPLVELVASLRARLGDYGLVVDQRDYRPHVTLARKMTSSPSVFRFEPIVWSFTEFALLESVSTPAGVRYPPVCVWPLQEG